MAILDSAVLATFRSAAAVAIALACATPRAHADPATSGGCPEAGKAWIAGPAAVAETHARACLEITPGDPRAWYELARALAAQGKYEEALTWSRRAITTYPDDMDWRALHVRILAWSGDLEAAWSHAGSLTPAAMADPETARLVADVAFWHKRNADATRLYSTWLDRFGANATVHRNRGFVYLALDQPTRALADARAACGLAKQYCDEYDELRKRLSTYDTRAELRWTDANTSDGWGDLIVGVDRRFVGGSRVGLRLDLQDRFGPLGTKAAVFTVSGSWALPRRWVVFSAAALGLFDSPLRYSVQVEPGRAFAFGLEAYFKLWYLDYHTGAVAIASPSVIFTRPKYELRARYFLSQKSETGLTHAVAGEAHYTGLARYRFALSASGGQSADVDDALGEGLIEVFWHVGAALTREISWRQTVTIGYSRRAGTVDLGIPLIADREFVRSRLELRYELKL